MSFSLIDAFKSATLLLALLNPLLLIIYLIDVVKKRDLASFCRILARAGLISVVIFAVFAVLGEVVFSDIMKVQFSSFQIFGGVIFLLIGVQFMLKGPEAIEMLRGESESLPTAIAIPILVGPGTISASVVIGKEAGSSLQAIAAIIMAITVTIGVMILLKILHDYVKPKKEPLIQRYIEIVGRFTAIYIGTVSIEMITNGLADWINTNFNL